MSEQDKKNAHAKAQQWAEHNRAKAETLAKQKQGRESSQTQGAGKPRQFHTIRGVRDILPPETAFWNSVEQRAREVFGAYGFGEIRLPIIEPTELFARSIGLDTDVVSKEMFTFPIRPTTGELAEEILDMEPGSFTGGGDFIDPEQKERFEKQKKGESASLRPEATASVCRAYIEHGMQSLPAPVKLCYMGPMFRRERPQKGRYRQFYQIGAEVLGGSDAAAIDAEVIEMVMVFLERVGLYEPILQINSIGDRECRPKYVDLLRRALEKVRDRLKPDSQRRIENNPLRVLDSKVPSEQSIIENLPRIKDHLCEPCRQHYAQVIQQLELRNIPYRENWRLVRGLDYYVRTTFEVTARGLGSQDAVCGGGRYDGLVELLGGPRTSGIGFAIGTDRLIMALNETVASTNDTVNEDLPSFSVALQRPDVAVAGTSQETWGQAITLAASLRQRGLSVFLPKSGTKLPKVFDAAHRMGIQVAIIVGENESRQKRYVVRVLSPLETNRPRDLSVKMDEVVLYGKIVKLRQGLERSLLRLAAGKSELDRQANMPSLVTRLVEKGLLPAERADEINQVLPTLNRAIHGESLAEGSVHWALAYGNLLLNELENLSPVER